MAAVAALGIALAAYLLYTRETGGRLGCTTGGCETVQGSRYSEIGASSPAAGKPP